MARPASLPPRRSPDRLGRVRAALSALTSPLLPDDYTELLNRRWSTRELRGEIIAAEAVDERTTNLTIAPGWGVPLDFQAGQFIGIGLPIEGRYLWRSYSLTNAPVRGSDSTFTVTVRAIDSGVVSQHIRAHARPGLPIRLAAPAGDFHLTDPVAPKLLFVSAGTGITPIISMLRYLRASDALRDTDVIIAHSARRREEVLFADELAQLSAHPQVTVRLTITSEHGRLRPEDLIASIPDIAEREIYVCGPEEFIRDTERACEGCVDTRRVHSERFTLDRSAAAANPGGVVHFSTGAQVEVDGATTLLEAAEQIGVTLPHGCRMGICHTCVQEIKDGHVIDLETGRDSGPGERVRVCSCVPSGEVRL